MKKAELREFWKHCAKPERIVWAVAQHEEKCSICPLGWKMKTSASPAMMAISVAPSRFTHDLIANSGEFVLAWPGENLAEETLLCGTKSGRDIDKFEKTGLTALKGQHVETPLIGECIGNLECRLVGRLTTGDHSIFAGEILAAWIHETPVRSLLSIDSSAGYDFLLENYGYRLGVVKA
jgi:flavin reductase (DIM6/NTAB) family NADH-FMN oxidoreductase RutF